MNDHEYRKAIFQGNTYTEFREVRSMLHGWRLFILRVACGDIDANASLMYGLLPTVMQKDA